MEAIERSIEVAAPIHAVYDQWSHFEEFPKFMEGVESVTRYDNNHLHWSANVGGQKKEWDAEIVEVIPDRKIAWKSTHGAINSGEVDFSALDAQHTRVVLHLSYEPQGMVERMGNSLGLLSRRIEEDLARFKHYVQDKGIRASGNAESRSNVPADYDTSGRSGV